MKQVMATAVAWALLILPTASVARDNLVWFPSTTTTGCIYYRTAFAANVARQKTKMKRAVWTGTPCQPGKPINGEGTLEETIADGGHPDGWQRRSTGRFVDGVPHGPIALSDTFNRQPQMRVYDRGCDDNALCVKRDLPSLAASAPAISAPQARTPPASSAGLTSQQIAACSAEIKRVQVESQSWSGGVAAVSLRLGRIQKGLFTGACAGHPEARAYLAGAERMIADGSGATAGTSPSSAPSSRPAASAHAPGGRKSHLHPSGQPCIAATAAPPRPHGRNGTLYGIDFTNICDQTFVVSGLRIPLGPQTRGLTQETGIARGSLGAPGKTTVTCIDDGKGGSDGCSGFSEWRAR